LLAFGYIANGLARGGRNLVCLTGEYILQLLLSFFAAMNGANLGITEEFDLHYKRLENGRRSTADLWVFGVLNAIPFLAGGVL
jgi:hypothetical protein